MNTSLTKAWYVTFLPAAFVLAVIATISAVFQVPMPAITRDVASLADVHPLSGFLSSLSILLWCTTAAICLFSAITIRRTASTEVYRFLLFSSFLSMYLLFDDLFLFHESLAPDYLGLSQRFVILFIGIATLSYLIMFRHIILRTNYLFLVLALGFLTTSVALDVYLEQWMWGIGHWVYFLEDGTKWLGISTWCSYYSQTSFHLLRGLDLHADPFMLTA